MKSNSIVFIAASALVGLASYSMPLYAQETDNINAFSMCSNETEHSKLYEYGEKLAEGWIYWIKTKGSEEKKNPVKTKNSFFTRALVGYSTKYKIADTGILYYCYLGYNSTIKKVSWSSVHQGLVDYLPPQSKTKFLSLPER
jgi:hypothetical protein